MITIKSGTFTTLPLFFFPKMSSYSLPAKTEVCIKFSRIRAEPYIHRH